MAKIKQDKVKFSVNKAKQYIYIVQASDVLSFCKIGRTDDYQERLKTYNNTTGKPKNISIFRYLFVCEAKDMKKLEDEIKENFRHLREIPNKEVYFYNEDLFKSYVNFIKQNPLFVKEIYIKTEDKKQIVKIVKKTTPSLKERGISPKDVLQKAQKKRNNDEFYTRYEDVEKELSMYNKSIWKNKTVFCNCDDPVGDDEINTSAFSLYFIKNFNAFEIKKLICTHFGDNGDLFNQGTKGYVFTKDGFREFKEYPKGYTGSFDHPLSLKILKEDADIVCSNPPFSRAADYWKITIGSGKKFLIISNIANVLTTAYLPYFYNNKVWAGYNEVDWFLTPKRELTRAAGHWYTNFPIKNRPKYKQLKIIPLKDIPDKYKKYDDTKKLVVDNGYIPNDYKKPFAVSTRPILNGLLEKGYKLIKDKEYYPYINGKKCFGRVLVQKI